MIFCSGFESTHIFGTGQDVLNLTNHTDFYDEDLQLVSDCGLKLLRYSAPWHSIEKEPGVYDWSWLDKAVERLRSLGIAPIFDPLHHTSFPEWLIDGFANPNFGDAYVNFVTALAARYPWVRHYTVVNEPFVTIFFCGHEGIWYPYQRGGANFVKMLLNVCEAICRITKNLIEMIEDVRFIHVDTCETHRAVDVESIEETVFRNELRFLVQDLILGKVSESHPLYYYLRVKGASREKLRWFTENPARIDLLGLDYYAHSELEWSRADKRIYPNQAPVGFAAVALEYVERYNLPVMLSETNLKGSVTDRITWLKFMVEECELLEAKLKQRGIEFHGFCWYPFIDSTDWISLVREARGIVDPQGIYSLDKARERRTATELSEIFAALANGKITAADVPAYHFQSPLDKELKGFLPLMRHWEWQKSYLPEIPVIDNLTTFVADAPLSLITLAERNAAGTLVER